MIEPLEIPQEVVRVGVAVGLFRNDISVLQGGVCMFAGLAPCGGKLGIEHDHETMVIRGIACQIHNRALAALGDNAAGLVRALAAVQGAALDV